MKRDHEGRYARRAGWALCALVMILAAAPAARAEAEVASAQTVEAGAAPAPAEGQPAGEYDPSADMDPSALTDFRATLEPHGQWVDDPTYGTVWVPHTRVVGPDFVPYRTAGRWAVADDGAWVWVSDYDWGYIPFHYGRWVWVSGRGWAWIPGRVWAPAWVVWRVGEPGYDYVGWCAMPPAYVWVDGVAVGFATGALLAWWFVPSYWLFHPHWHHHVVHHHRAHAIASHTHVHHGHHRAHAHAHAKATGHAKASAKASASSRMVKSEADGQRFSAFKPSSPSFKEARIPAAAVPAKRVQHDERALGLRRPADAPRTAPATQAQRSPAAGGGALGRAPGPRITRAGEAPAARESFAGRRPRAEGRPETPTVRRIPSGRGSYDAPARWSQPRGYDAPSQRGAATRTWSAPSRSFSAPSQRGAATRAWSAPSRSFSAPSQRGAATRSFNAPSRSSSAPSRSFGAPSRSAPSRATVPRSSGGGRSVKVRR